MEWWAKGRWCCSETGLYAATL